MKLFFSASITGGVQDKNLYYQMAQLLQKYGQIQSEYVQQELVVKPPKDTPPEYFHNRDLTWISQSDVVIAKVTYPSHRVVMK